MLQQIIQSSSSAIDLDNSITPVVALSTFTPSTIYWFSPYKASDFPEVTCDKNYFFLYSTDHDGGDGGIYWGKGDNLDLSDFQELGLIIDGYQAETPFLYRFSGETRPIYLYYHTSITDPANSGIQQTRLITTTGGLLHTATWTQETNPITPEGGDDHTGYLKFWDNGISLKGVHYVTQILAGTSDGSQYYSTVSSDGLTLTRGEMVDIYSPSLPASRMNQLSFGRFFYKYNRWWWIGCTRRRYGYENIPTPGTTTNIYIDLVLCRANSDFEVTEMVAKLYEGGRYWECYIEGDIAYLYESVRGEYVRYATFYLGNLLNI